MYFFIFAVLISTILLLWYKNERKGPPGPIGIPILGYFPFMGSNQVLKLQKLSQKYGSIMKINLLNEHFYVLNSYEAINESFGIQGGNFSGRPVDEFFALAFIHKNGIVGAEGQDWKIQKKFYLNKLSGLGMGKNDFSYKIHEICDDLIENIKTEEEVNNLGRYTTNFALNIISTLTYGKKYSLNDPDYKQLITSFEKIMGTGTDLGYYLTGAVAEFLMTLNKKIWNDFLSSLNCVFDFMHEKIKERMERGKTGKFNDILDYCIKEMKGPNSDLFEAQVIVRNYLLLFLAGTETTSSTLNFAFYYMAKNQEIQKKVFDEIMDVFGKNHQVLFNEIDQLNYTRAVMAEIQRIGCVVPLGVLHVNKEPATICGYNFPKRSKFIANIYGVSRDKKYFKNPEVFDPNNFLDENGNYTPTEAHIPFGIGKRKCLGYRLAEMELHIVFIRLMQEFEWLPPKDGEMKFEIINALVRYLSPFKIIAKPRV